MALVQILAANLVIYLHHYIHCEDSPTCLPLLAENNAQLLRPNGQEFTFAHTAMRELTRCLILVAGGFTWLTADVPRESTP